MASEELKKLLALSKNIDKMGKSSAQQSQKAAKKPILLENQIQSANKAVANIDAMFNAPYVPTEQEKQTWNSERGRDELNEMANNKTFMEKLNKSHLPAAILESMRKNPCNYSTDMISSNMGAENAFFKKLNEAYNKEKEQPISGIEAAQHINEQLISQDKQPKENSAAVENNESAVLSNIDASSIEKIVENVLDKKLSSLVNALQSTNSSSIKTMAITEGGTFRFLDSEDNVYECQMKYIGKRKKKKS